MNSWLGRVEFLISPNPGEPVRPLARIASGGEMSRIMLALKSVMAGANQVPTLIFDEIDVGVGGRTAEVLGQKMAALSQVGQVLCVTHLPQIAGMAARHFRIEKQVEAGRTRVEARLLEDKERIGELARMLGGKAETAEQHAQELLAAGEKTGRQASINACGESNQRKGEALAQSVSAHLVEPVAARPKARRRA